jgi:hypothetical protein
MASGTIRLHIAAGTTRFEARRHARRTLRAWLGWKPPWHVLDERLLRDVGKSACDAEWEALRRAWGCSFALDDLKTRNAFRAAFGRV